MHKARKVAATLSVAGLMTLGGAAPALAAGPVVTGGLVNVTVTDVLNDNQVNVQVPIGVAADVCGVQANVLAERNTQDPIDCTSSTTQDLPVAFRP